MLLRPYLCSPFKMTEKPGQPQPTKDPVTQPSHPLTSSGTSLLPNSARLTRPVVSAGNAGLKNNVPSGSRLIRPVARPNATSIPVASTSSSSGSTESSAGIRTAAVASGNTILVNQRQRGNPILQGIRNVPWEYGDIVPDYVMGPTTCALFLSLKYHNLNPEYIHERLKQLGRAYNLRILLVLIDVKDPHHPLKELAKMTIIVDVTLIPAWSPEEAGKYIELYKMYEKKPADFIQGHVDVDYMSELTEALTTIKSVNKTDVKTLSTNFKTFQGLTEASENDLSLLSGVGFQKAKRLHEALHQPFLRKKKAVEPVASTSQM